MFSELSSDLDKAFIWIGESLTGGFKCLKIESHNRRTCQF